MAEVWGVHGVPMALQHDGWWLDAGPPTPTTGAGRKPPVVALALLVLWADVLFWRQGAGLSLALFAVAVFAASLRGTPGARPVITLFLSVLPVVDHLQPLSVLFLTGGLVAAITLTRVTTTDAATGVRAALRLAGQIPLRGLRDGATALSHLRRDLSPANPMRQIARAWAFPVGGTLVLVALLVQANPILDHWLTGVPLDPVTWVRRGLFWSGVALMLWPLLVVTPSGAPFGHPCPWPQLGLNATSVTHALVAFNAVLGLQTLLDARYLWSGASLPPGMTLATYAHRGAYPLLATALLAGAFALAARPWLAERRALKPLLMLWLGQNILLTVSALYRLDLYVQSFGLTYLRLYALIWMGLVAAGLALTLCQIATNRSNLWLVARCTGLGLATLYTCAFLNLADLIARTNLAMGKIDAHYLCELGPTAAASIPATLKGPPDNAICTVKAPQPQTWRNWGFRNWLVLRNLARQEAAYENPRRR